LFPILTNHPLTSAIKSKTRFFLLVILSIHFFVSSVFAQDKSLLVNQLKEKAAQLQLWQQPKWHALIHYKQNTFGSGYTSQVDAPEFFLATDGKTNPQAELEATIAALYAEGVDGEEHPRCIFVARALWLTEVLQLDATKLAEADCSRFEKWYAALDPHKLTLVFPTAFINNPSSMFGHTLLRIDNPTQTAETNLLAYASNYAAETQGDNAIIYAFKGIFGGYLGKFSVTPYYERLKQYQDMEDRDVWEYELNFSPEEVKFIVFHLWELKNFYLDYYYFDENCAYFLLALLEVPRDSLRMSDQFHGWVIPVDTVRAVSEQPNLISKISYRPSPGTILRHIAATRSAKELELIKGIGTGEQQISADLLNELSEVQQADVLDSAGAYLNYQVVAGKKTNDEAAPLFFEILKERSKLPGSSSINDVPEPKIRPEQGHKTARAKVSGGWEEDKWFYQLEWRPAYQDLLDPDGGYKKGAQINFFDFAFRQQEGSSLRVQRFAPLEIVSLSPRDALIKPKSWELGLRYERKMLRDRERHGVSEFDGGMGVSYEWWDRMLVFGLARGAMQYSTNLDDNYALGYGGRFGVALDFFDNARTLLESKVMRYGVGADRFSMEHVLSERINISTQAAVVLSVRQGQDYKRDWLAADAGIEVFF